MPDEHLPSKDLQDLSRAISKAIINSDDVRQTLYYLHRQGLVGPDSFLALVLRLNDLIELVEGKSATAKPKPTRRTTRRRKAADGQMVDGRKLTSSELAFLRYCEERFDEESWLRSLRIRLE